MTVEADRFKDGVESDFQAVPEAIGDRFLARIHVHRDAVGGDCYRRL